MAARWYEFEPPVLIRARSGIGKGRSGTVGRHPKQARPKRLRSDDARCRTSNTHSWQSRTNPGKYTDRCPFERTDEPWVAPRKVAPDPVHGARRFASEGQSRSPVGKSPLPAVSSPVLGTL